MRAWAKALRRVPEPPLRAKERSRPVRTISRENLQVAACCVSSSTPPRQRRMTQFPAWKAIAGRFGKNWSDAMGRSGVRRRVVSSSRGSGVRAGRRDDGSLAESIRDSGSDETPRPVRLHRGRIFAELRRRRRRLERPELSRPDRVRIRRLRIPDPPQSAVRVVGAARRDHRARQHDARGSADSQRLARTVAGRHHDALADRAKRFARLAENLDRPRLRISGAARAVDAGLLLAKLLLGDGPQLRQASRSVEARADGPLRASRPGGNSEPRR